MPQDTKLDVRWPGQATDPAGKDLSQPIARLLQDTSMLGDDKQQEGVAHASAAFTGTPTAVAIVEAGATALSKWWAVAVAAVGGTSALFTAIRAFWGGLEPSVQITTIGATALIMAATIIAIAAIVRADVTTRGRGAVALYEARARVAGEFMRLTQAPRVQAGAEGASSTEGVNMAAMATAALACGNDVTALGPQGWDSVRGVRGNAGMVEVKFPDTWVPLSTIRELRVKSAAAASGANGTVR